MILYTSGTTGLPKGALISHRAFIARALVFMIELGLAPGEAFVAWAPFFHMVSTDHALASLLRGNPVIVVDGYDPEALAAIVARERIGWLPLVPGMIESFAAVLRAPAGAAEGHQGDRRDGGSGAAPSAGRDHDAARTRPTPTPSARPRPGCRRRPRPSSRSARRRPTSPSARARSARSAWSTPTTRRSRTATPGECAVRGPTLFSGYWRAPEVNARDFRGGWFHMGDMFIRRDDGRLDFVDRAKYMIKSGGENVYPAEIERVLLADPRVDDAVVVRRPTRAGARCRSR